jgi:hypothetical protein
MPDARRLAAPVFSIAGNWRRGGDFLDALA